MWIEDGSLLVRLAFGADEIAAAQRVRYQVFNVELSEGLEQAEETGLDVDEFDEQCDHLVLIDRSIDEIVGTYRLQTAEQAAAGRGFYCDQEFVLHDLGPSVLDAGIELGRACVLPDYRKGPGLLALWRGLVGHATALEKRYLFGCSSLTGIDDEVASLADAWVDQHRFRHATLSARTREAFRHSARPMTAEALEAFRPPRLFATYLRYMTRVCSAPALDREFGTTDFLVICDLENFEPRMRRLLMES